MNYDVHTAEWGMNMEEVAQWPDNNVGRGCFRLAGDTKGQQIALQSVQTNIAFTAEKSDYHLC